MKSRSLLRLLPVLALLSLDCSWAQVSAEQRLSDASTVGELMRADAALAVRRMKERLRVSGDSADTPDPAGRTATRQGPVPRLTAIYGVGKKLLAQVQVGSEPVLYMRGKPTPIGRPADPAAFHLKDINGTCIELERKDEAHTLCLHPLGFPGS